MVKQEDPRTGPVSRREFLKLGAAASATAFLAACAPTVKPRPQEIPSPKDPLDALLDQNLLEGINEEFGSHEFDSAVNEKMRSIIKEALPRIKKIVTLAKDQTDEELYARLEHTTNFISFSDTPGPLLEPSKDPDALRLTRWWLAPTRFTTSENTEKIEMWVNVSNDYLKQAKGVDALAWILGASVYRDFKPAPDFFNVGFTTILTKEISGFKAFHHLSVSTSELLAQSIRHKSDGKSYLPQVLDGQKMSNALALILNYQDLPPAALYRYYYHNDPYSLMGNLFDKFPDEDETDEEYLDRLRLNYSEINYDLGQVEIGKKSPQDVLNKYLVLKENSPEHQLESEKIPN